MVLLRLYQRHTCLYSRAITSPAHILRRLNSTTAASSSSASPSLSWNDFLRVRSYRRVTNLGVAGIGGTVGLIVGYNLLADDVIDPTATVYGVDPFIFTALELFGFGLVGAIIGRGIGDVVFKFAVLRSKAPLFQTKENLFLQHIKKNRVDPSHQSFANPVPDYYGEKITSLHGYRRWLRDCAAYKKKRDEFIK
ncbi:mitochondrial import protein Pam17 [Lipomyces japonicus]|uniref:mitochondrial import protein Pam17 n=1 Tax=Lipomyces japonicus TaxID=56871 RepID=UPI0034CD390B